MSLRTFLILLTLSTAAHAEISPWTLTLEGRWARNLQGPVFRHDNGLGGSLFLEHRFLDFLSLGLGADLTAHFGVETPHPTVTSFLGPMARLFPFGEGAGSWTPFLLGGFGLDPVWGTGGAETGRFHGFAGLGVRAPLDPGKALDLAATWDVFSPTDEPAQQVNLRLGLTLLLGRAREAAAPEREKAPAAGTGKFHPLSLRAVAAREYGDPDLYPLLVDANFKDYLAAPRPQAEAHDLPTPSSTPKKELGVEAHRAAEAATLSHVGGARKAPTPSRTPSPTATAAPTPAVPKLPEGATLAVPRVLTSGTVKDAKEKAERPEYRAIEERFRLPEPKEGLEPVRDAEPEAKRPGAYDSIPYLSKDLWELAGRADVYGDPELYPLLVDANRKTLEKGPSENRELRIPRGLPEAELLKAKLKAWSPDYTRLRGRDVTRQDYEKWRLEHGL